MTDLVQLDGSQGEGGGQIVRSALALSLVTGRPVCLTNVRGRRPKPGLMRQHLTAAAAAAEIGAATMEGAALGSRSLSFWPRAVRPGCYRFSVGTAGSATLVLQTVLPALLLADGPSELVLEGGTHNQWAPPFDFLQRAYLPLVARMGPRVSARLERHGFYPAGGGRFTVTVEPAAALAGFDLLDRGEIVESSARILLANLPHHIAEREREVVLRKTRWPARAVNIQAVDAAGPGNAVVIEVRSRQVAEVFTGFGRIGVRAEEVAREALGPWRDYLDAGAPVGPYLADQLLLPLGISAARGDAGVGARGGAFCTLPLSGHALTHVEVLRQFLEVAVSIEPDPAGRTCTVRVAPA